MNDFLTFMATCNGAKGFKDGEDSPPLVFHVSEIALENQRRQAGMY